MPGFGGALLALLLVVTVVLTPERLRSVYGVSVLIERLSQGQTVCAPDYGVPSPRLRGEG
jgi:hypothetical protein